MSAAAIIKSSNAVELNQGIDNPAYSVDEIELTDQRNGIENEEAEIPAANVATETTNKTNPKLYVGKEDDELPVITNNVEKNENPAFSLQVEVQEDQIEVVEETEPHQMCITRSAKKNTDSLTILDETRTSPEKYEYVNHLEKHIGNGAGTLAEQFDNFANEFNDYSKEEIQETITTKNTKRYELQRWNKRKSCCFIFFIILFFAWLGGYYVYSIEYFQKKIYDFQ